MPRESRIQQRARATEILRRLRRRYPDAKCELDWSTPLELAVATILSAQCTDKRVNLVTPALFKKYRTARDWARTPRETLEREFHSTGFFRNKAKNVRALMARLDAEFGGALPNWIFRDVLDLPTLWIPHSYNGCAQHAPDEHALEPVLNEGLMLMAGLFWEAGSRPERLSRILAPTGPSGSIRGKSPAGRTRRFSSPSSPTGQRPKIRRSDFTAGRRSTKKRSRSTHSPPVP